MHDVNIPASLCQDCTKFSKQLRMKTLYDSSLPGSCRVLTHSAGSDSSTLSASNRRRERQVIMSSSFSGSVSGRWSHINMEMIVHCRSSIIKLLKMLNKYLCRQTAIRKTRMRCLQAAVSWFWFTVTKTLRNLKPRYELIFICTKYGWGTLQVWSLRVHHFGIYNCEPFWWRVMLHSHRSRR